RPPPRPPFCPYTTLFRSDTPYLVPACAFNIMGSSTMVLPSSIVIIACHQFIPASMKPPARVYVVMTTLIPIQRAAMFHVDHVRRSEEHTSELQSQSNLVC